jgi:hypothetical protein
LLSFCDIDALLGGGGVMAVVVVQTTHQRVSLSSDYLAEEGVKRRMNTLFALRSLKGEEEENGLTGCAYVCVLHSIFCSPSNTGICFPSQLFAGVCLLVVAIPVVFFFISISV